MRLSALLATVPTLDVRGPTDREATRVTRDSRDADPDAIFVAVPGARVDGHSFADRVDAGVVVVEREVPVRDGATRVLVRSSKEALALFAAALHGFPGRAMKVVAITGTNGKTTTATLVDDAMRHLGVKCGRIGTTGNSIDGVPREAGFTTPEAPELQGLLAEMRDAGCAAVAIEASSIGLAQHRVDGIPFHVGVFTNLTQDHLDFHGTMDAYRDAKARLFRELLRPAGGAPRAERLPADGGARGTGAPSRRGRRPSCRGSRGGPA